MLSIQDLINNQFKEEEKFITVRIERMNGEIKLRVPTALEIDEYKIKHKGNYEKIAEDLVYNNCIEPKLNDDKLLETLKCKNVPIEIVEKVFGYGVKIQLSDLLIDEAMKKYKIAKLVDTVKN